MYHDNTLLEIEIGKALRASGISASTIEFFRDNNNITTYLIDSIYIFKISTSILNEQAKYNRVRSIQFVPRVYSSGSFTISDYKYHYMIIDYVQGNELWSVVNSLTDKEKYEIGKEIAQFLNYLHSLTNDYYDIGHYIPTIPRYSKSWKEGHLEYIKILQNGLSEINIETDSQKIIANSFEYIYTNIDSLDYQAGAKLLHNDFHPKNIIVHKGRLAGIIDWECSQFGEADFELSHLFHWCIYPMVQENNLDVLLKSIIKNLQTILTVPDIEKRMTIYQLEHELNQLIWNGKRQEEERIYRINGWLNGKIAAFMKL